MTSDKAVTEPVTIRAELDLILASPAFRSSPRCCDFLRYVVTHALAGAELKERTIGAEVFHRPADYDTGDDSIVRVKATEVRKRLAQYYRESPPRPVRIALPAGSYTPEFRPEPAPPARAASRRRLAVALSLLVLLASAAAGWWWSRPPSPIRAFWEPFLDSSRPVLLCVAHPVVYSLNTQGEPVRDPDHYVGVGDALSLAHLSAFLTREGVTPRARIGNDTSFSDLRNSPAVLIGAYTNQWTMQVANNLRFAFDRQANESFIKDNMDPSRRWVYQRGKTDYAIITRVLGSPTGDLMIAAAGLSHHGTRMAGEFLTDPELVRQAFAAAPRDWASRNLQLVLEAQVIGNTPGPPKVAAIWYW